MPFAISREHLAVGFYLSGHPLDDYSTALKRNKIINFSEVEDKVKNGASIIKIAGTVTARQERKSARGNRYAFVQLSDPSAIYEVTMFSDVLEASREFLEPGDNIVLTVDANLESGQLKILARSVQHVDKVISGGALAVYQFYLYFFDMLQHGTLFHTFLDENYFLPTEDDRLCHLY